MSDIRTRRAVLRAAALFAVMALLAACSDSSPTTSVDDTEATTAPTTAPSETTVTTEAPTTTEGTTETTTGTTDTTVADDGAEMIPVEPEEGLARTFPVSAGWIVDSGDNSVTVGMSVGPMECYGLASAEVEETAEEVLVTLTAGFREDATSCGDAAPFWTYEFELSEPLGDRPVVDSHTGLELGTERPDPDA